jgi:DNA replication and repair protein RecF
MIYKDKNMSSVEGNIKKDFENNYKIIISEDGKKVKIDNTLISKISDYISKINVVVFSPDDLKIIKDTPSTRRKTINIEISQINVSYLKNLSNYNKILKQRNAYLKTLAVNSNVSTDYLLGIDKGLTVDVSGLTDDDIKVIHAIIERLRSKHN